MGQIEQLERRVSTIESFISASLVIAAFVAVTVLILSALSDPATPTNVVGR